MRIVNRQPCLRNLSGSRRERRILQTLVAAMWVTVVSGATLACHRSPAPFCKQRAKVVVLGSGCASTQLRAPSQPETSASGPPPAQGPDRHRLQRHQYPVASPALSSTQLVQSLATGGRGGTDSNRWWFPCAGHRDTSRGHSLGRARKLGRMQWKLGWLIPGTGVRGTLQFVVQHLVPAFRVYFLG